ncbi:hypothetical protein BLNAU_18158 [Blattamonas nauphoetae]|uniref:Uncharacterized protein n=1 Tax=Blattamonas nauphoetae TaxID=2049346 RepID=A0ABQ9X577_9EUKA|nr:hypothetical protein BLNAU_18158 [Blattamonas nauphoetae]
MNLTPIEVNHASRFLKYACKDIKYRGHPHDILLETIFPNETERQTSLVSSLINLLSLPSDTLRTDVLSFFDIGLSQLTYKFSVTVTNTRLTPKLFSVLKPQEIPLCDATMTFHRHLTSILDELFHNSPPEALFICFMNDYYPSHKKEPIFKIIESIFQPFCTYLRYLVTAPVCTTDHCSGYALLSNMRQFDPVIIKDYARSSSPEISRFFGEIRKDMMAEMVPMLGLSSTSEAEHYLNYRQKDVMNIPCWMEAFECLLARVSEGRQLSDFGADAVMNFLLQIPKEIHLVFWSDGTFTLKMEVPPKCHMLDAYGLTKRDKIISSPKLDSNSLWKLFTPSHRHQAAIVLAAFHNFMEHLDNATFLKHVWNSWFPSFVNAISPSTLPFTADFIRLLTNLITVLNDHLTKIRRFECQNDRSMTDQLRSNLDETYHAFYKQTKDYVIHLSHHPFTLKDFRQDTILEFLNKTYLHDFEDSLSKPYRDGVRQEMDASTLASSSPPFILTSELVCGHTDAEIIEIIDRIVALLESDSYTLQLTFDEWDDVDLETIGIVIRTINENRLSIASVSNGLHTLIQNFVFQSLPQIHHSAARLCQSQLERLIASTIDILVEYFLQPIPYESSIRWILKKRFIVFSKLCDQRVIAQCFSRTGFFSRIVADLFNQRFASSYHLFSLIIDRPFYSDVTKEDQFLLRRTVPNFLEEGWQDSLDYRFVQKDFSHHDDQPQIRHMMQFFGANMNEVKR